MNLQQKSLRKGVSKALLNQYVIMTSGIAVIQWETEFSIWGIRLETFFADKELPKLWGAIKKERDNLDLALYMLTARNQGTTEDILKLIKQISDMTIDLSQRVLEEINNMKQSGVVYKE